MVEYNETSRQYIHTFMLAFEKGDIDKLPHHPFVPSLEVLEQAIDRRKATLVEKVQADDRVKKLEFMNSKEMVTMKVLKRNEEAFLRAVDIAKQQFRDTCATWLDRVSKLLSPMPHHAQMFDCMKARISTQAQRPQVQEPENSIKYTPLKKTYVPPPQYLRFNRRQVFTQDLEMPQEMIIVTPERSAKRPAIGSVSPEMKSTKMPVMPDTQYAFPRLDFEQKDAGNLIPTQSPQSKRPKIEHVFTSPQTVGNIKMPIVHPFFSEYAEQDTDFDHPRPGLGQKEESVVNYMLTPHQSPGHARQKTQPNRTPPQSPNAASHHEDCGNQENGVEPKVIDLTSSANEYESPASGHGVDEEVSSIAHVLTSLYGDKSVDFAVTNI